MLTIYHNPRCRKSRETLKLIEESGQEFQTIEYLKTPPSEDELRQLVEKLGLPVEYLIRKGEKDFIDGFKDKKIESNEWFKILSTHPILIERPIVVNGDQAILGRPPENVKKLLPE